MIPGGPFASQEAIKELGTNGGGSLNANSAHPFENPNGFTNLLQIFLLLLIPFALTYTFGRFAKNQKQGWAIFAAMFILWFAASASPGLRDERQPRSSTTRARRRPSPRRSRGGNMEGKEVRFGSAGCGLFAASTTGTSTGAVNCSTTA